MNSRTCSNPKEERKAGPFPVSAEARPFPLAGSQALLIHQSLNELLNGIRGIQVYPHVGLSKPALKEIFDPLNDWIRAQETDANGLPIATFDQPFSITQIRALRNAVELVMLDLGQDEFSTRTGFSLAAAAELLDRFNAALLDPLHIDRQAQAFTH
jgi:hypothetical protein